jgi:hypothetical protein
MEATLPFLVYQTTKASNGLRYSAPMNVSLSSHGLVWAACKTYLGQSDAGWTVSVEELLHAGGYQPDIHALIIDTAPRRPTVSLFEIRYVSGYSYADWTPIMVTLEELFVDRNVAPTTTELFKKDFVDVGCQRCTVRSILYLLGGRQSGTWNWGGNSRTTAALLWDDAWEYFRQPRNVLQ